MLPGLVAFFTARIGGLSDRSDAIRPSGLGVKSRFLAKKQLCWEVMIPEIWAKALEALKKAVVAKSDDF